jgi:hypothetical protein
MFATGFSVRGKPILGDICTEYFKHSADSRYEMLIPQTINRRRTHARNGIFIEMHIEHYKSKAYEVQRRKHG